MALVEVATVSPLFQANKSAVLYWLAADPSGEVPDGLAPTLGVVLATRLMPNCSVPSALAAAVAPMAVMVLAPLMRVALLPVAVKVKPWVALVATTMVLLSVAAAELLSVPRSMVASAIEKVNVWSG